MTNLIYMFEAFEVLFEFFFVLRCDGDKDAACGFQNKEFLSARKSIVSSD